MPKTKLFILPLIFTVIFIIVILKATPPPAITKASFLQLILFFLPLLLLLTSLFNILLWSWCKSFILGLGVILALILQALQSLNFFTLTGLVMAILLIIKALKNNSKTSLPINIPKLSRLKKQSRL
ncbi:MAG: hypothetical protein C4584_00035 [Armatimonadetes bacterium]|nr:MAG: hypothetical protein C4584_00035 [Armatimonadota bacterium]